MRQTQTIFIVGLLAGELASLRLFGDLVQGYLMMLSQRGRFNKFLIYSTVAPGVILHELAHASVAVLSGAGLSKVSLFHPQFGENGVTLGYVQPRYQPRLPGGKIFLSLAPLALPPLVLYLLATLLLPNLALWATPQATFSSAFSHLSSLGSLVWLFLFISMSLANFPSNEDFLILSRFERWLVLPLLAFLPLLCSIFSKSLADQALTPYLFFVIFLAPSALICVSLALILRLVGRR